MLELAFLAWVLVINSLTIHDRNDWALGGWWSEAKCKFTLW